MRYRSGSEVVFLRSPQRGSCRGQRHGFRVVYLVTVKGRVPLGDDGAAVVLPTQTIGDSSSFGLLSMCPERRDSSRTNHLYIRRSVYNCSLECRIGEDFGDGPVRYIPVYTVPDFCLVQTPIVNPKLQLMCADRVDDALSVTLNLMLRVVCEFAVLDTKSERVEVAKKHECRVSWRLGDGNKN